MAHIRIIYGTTGGNTQLTCQKVSSDLEELGHKVTLQRCEKTNPADLLEGDVLILASPTYGHGFLEPHFQLFMPSIENLDLQQKPCAVIALGDPKYDLDYFLESEKKLTAYLQSHNGNNIIEPLKIAKSPLPYFDKALKKWVEKLADKLTN
ncbi:flavodoxin family protein [Candidatus Gracilibacteria bacterium]|nr:flavodoxin family protein [Candidatus Gracilibacteria bacterium]